MMNDFGRRVYREGRLDDGWSGFCLGAKPGPEKIDNHKKQKRKDN
jgi:hypothetical protein